MKKFVLIILFFVFFHGYIIYAHGNIEKNPNEISEYYQKQISNKILKPISVLKDVDLSIFNTIIQYIPKNESYENYFYISSLEARETGDTVQVYNIYYNEKLFNKYNSFRGDPTGKCFTIEFNLNNEFIRRYYWR